VGFFKQGLAAVKINEKWGYIDKTGNFVISPEFDDARSFSVSKTIPKEAGLALVNAGGKWGYIRKIL
jgi:hypothetical protein